MRDRSIRKRLLLCIRTTIGVGVKQLVVPHANHYSFALGTTTGLSANDYYFHSRLQLLHATSSGKACLHMDATALRKDTSPPTAEAAGGDDYFRAFRAYSCFRRSCSRSIRRIKRFTISSLIFACSLFR